MITLLIKIYLLGGTYSGFLGCVVFIWKEKRSKGREKEDKAGCEREARVDTGGSKVKQEEKGTVQVEGGDR